MNIDVESLALIISKLPNPNTYPDVLYKVRVADIDYNSFTLTFVRYNFTDGTKKWVLTIN